MDVLKHRTWMSGVFLPITEASDPALIWSGNTAEPAGQTVVASQVALRGSAPVIADAKDSTAKASDDADGARTERLDAQTAPQAHAVIEIAAAPGTADAMPTPSPALAFAANFEGLSLPAPLARAAAAILPTLLDTSDAPANSADLIVPEDGTASAFTQVNEDGFGDAQNVYAWAMFSFNGLLYVTTLDLDGTQEASSGITGAGSVYRFDGTTWETISEDGLGNVDNDGFRCLNEYDGFLYAGSLNDTSGAELYRTADGVNWELVVSGGFGNPTNSAIRDLITFDGKLFVGVQAGPTFAGDIWVSEDGLNFETVTFNGFDNTDNESFHCFAEFGGFLYTGTRNSVTGGEIFRSADGVTWEAVVGATAVNDGGFGNALNNVVFHMMEFNGQLYATLGNGDEGFSLYRTSDGVTWEMIGEQGFGNPANNWGWRMEVYDGALWLGVSNGELGQGASLWRSEDGSSWQEMVGPSSETGEDYGFDNPINWGVRSLEVYDGSLYIGTANYPYDVRGTFATGAQVFVYNDGAFNITGTDAGETLVGEGQGDTIDGGGGDDLIRGKNGADSILGGDGNDTIEGNQGRDSIDGGAGDDVILAMNKADVVEGGAGNDYIEGNAGRDTLSGGEDDDLLYGGLDDDLLIGGRGADQLFGENQADTISGGFGADTLIGDGGTDSLDGEEGDDVMTGGKGADIFVFSSGQDTITDFSNNTDEVHIESAALAFLGLSTVEDVLLLAVVQDGNTVIDLGDGNILTLEDYSKIHHLVDDFVIV